MQINLTSTTTLEKSVAEDSILVSANVVVRSGFAANVIRKNAAHKFLPDKIERWFES
jgi:hypothetical protein